MTDNDIIKALECCGKYNVTHQDRYCNDCAFKGRGRCSAWLIDNIIGLINRQQAEIERLKIEKDNLIRTYAECQAEAVKEFAEKLSQRFKKTEIAPLTNRKTIRVEEADARVNAVLQNGVPNIIDNLVKEMVGEEE